MSTITYCDKCNKKQVDDAKIYWSSLEITNADSLGIREFKNFSANFKFCPECAKVLASKVYKILKKK